MSTFDGRVKEFPDIRIDYFRPSPRGPPPLAYFLSHVHSDHLVGLESRKSLFIYCSPGTRDILLRLEKYPHRMNFARGILESRRQTYGHLKKVLKAIPLETPTVIELHPGRSLRVTLVDANHCVGGVGFLIDGDGKAVFYTGDVRAEGWWVEGLVKSPAMIPFTVKGGRRLDCLYLDTTFATKQDGGRYREFPSKAEGLRELLEKVEGYPKDTLFYYDAWTFGYEDVWQTLSTVLDAQVHVDEYRYGLYRALANGIEPRAPEATKLIGFYCGNHFQEGCLTDRWSRLHSCEHGTGCAVWDKDFVRITPIISRHNGVEMRELGAGGGKGDLNPKHELEFGDIETIATMIEAYEAKMKNQPDRLSTMWKSAASVMQSGAQSIQLDVAALGLNNEANSQVDDYDALEDLPLGKLLPALAEWLQKDKRNDNPKDQATTTKQPPGQSKSTNSLPRQITFPYSRHSSYAELAALVAALRPRDIHPCTVDSANWDFDTHSMRALFGHLYAEEEEVAFSHDAVMVGKLAEGEGMGEVWRPYRDRKRRWSEGEEEEERGSDGGDVDGSPAAESHDEPQVQRKKLETPPMRHERLTNVLSPGEAALAWRKEVHGSALGARGGRWEDVELVSVAGHQMREVEM